MMDYSIKCETDHFDVTGHRAAVTHEGDPSSSKGRHLSGNTHAGGQVESWIDEEGNFTAELRGPLEPGRAGEWHALKILLQKLHDSESSAVEVSGACDADGEDGLVEIDGREWTVQIVTVPADPMIWEALARDGLKLSGDLHDAVEYVRSALLKKARMSRDVILVLEASALGAAVSPKVVEAYIQKYGNPESELRAAQVWLIGRTQRSAFRMHDLSPSQDANGSAG